MPAIGAGLGRVINLCARHSAILARVPVAHDRHFLHFVLAEKQVGRAGVVQVQVRIIFVVAVHREQVRGRRQTKGCEVAIATAARGIDLNSR